MYNKTPASWGKHLDFILIDLLCLHVAFVLAYMIRHSWICPYFEPEYRGILVALSMFSILISVFFYSFQNVLRRGYYQEFAATVKHVCLVVFLSTFYIFLVQEGERFRSARPLETDSVEALKVKFAGREMDEIMYNTALHLADLLRERIHSAELYASPEAKDLYPVMFKSSCRLIGNALKLMAGEERQGKMAVLEVGAGHGVGTYRFRIVYFDFLNKKLYQQRAKTLMPM